MSEKKVSWYQQWFNEDYLNLYSHRNADEAEQQVDFIIDALELKGGEKILDLGCGAGRHAIAFAERGYDVLGIDLSTTLIREAKASLQRKPSLSAEFQVGDMLRLEGIGTFDVVINLFTSFGYFEDDAKNRQIFEVAGAHLRPGGKFFLDYLHPAQVKRDLVPHTEKEVQGEKVIITKVLEGDLVFKTITFPGRSYEERVKLYTRDQLEQMLAASGFTVVKVWNGYNGTPWNSEGDRQLFFAIKTGSSQ